MIRRRWIMSRNIIFVLIYHHHELLDHNILTLPKSIRTLKKKGKKKIQDSMQNGVA
jgi:hypothetical protein